MSSTEKLRETFYMLHHIQTMNFFFFFFLLPRNREESYHRRLCSKLPLQKIMWHWIPTTAIKDVLCKMTSSSQGVAICLSHGVGIWPRKEKSPIPFRQKAYNQNNINRNTGLGFEPLRLTLDFVQKLSLTPH